VYWGGWSYEPDYYPTGGGLFATGAGSNAGGYADPIMDQLIQKSYGPGSALQTRQTLNAYQAYAVKKLPVIWMPYNAQYFEHARSIHGTMKEYNPVTNINYPNYWRVST
ncbi:MAG: peptide ABC transporter substrate-binding protein, partial [Firmicutes bacterium]|nr:peptide ABC transporter substrate-binding protein [Bacillota bacterium]